jgi:hypothetical protein
MSELGDFPELTELPERINRHRAEQPKRLVSRRTALTAAAGIGATVVASSVTYVASAKTPKATPVQGPVVVRVRDLSAGRLEVFTGSDLIVIRDKDLAARLVRAAQR